MERHPTQSLPTSSDIGSSSRRSCERVIEEKHFDVGGAAAQFGAAFGGHRKVWIDGHLTGRFEYPKKPWQNGESEQCWVDAQENRASFWVPLVFCNISSAKSWQKWLSWNVNKLFAAALLPISLKSRGKYIAGRWRMWYCWCFRNHANQLIGKFSHYLQGFLHPWWLARFLPSTVLKTTVLCY